MTQNYWRDLIDEYLDEGHDHDAANLAHEALALYHEGEIPRARDDFHEPAHFAKWLERVAARAE